MQTIFKFSIVITRLGSTSADLYSLFSYFYFSVSHLKILRFRETYVEVLTRKNTDRVVTVYYQYSRKRLSRVSYDATPSPAYDHLAAAVCYALRFSQFFALTSAEAYPFYKILKNILIFNINLILPVIFAVK